MIFVVILHNDLENKKNSWQLLQNYLAIYNSRHRPITVTLQDLHDRKGAVSLSIVRISCSSEVTLIYELDLYMYIPKMCPCTKNEICRTRLSKLRARTVYIHKQTHRWDRKHYAPHSKMIKIKNTEQNILKSRFYLTDVSDKVLLR